MARPATAFSGQGVTFDQVLRGFARVPLAPGETRTVTFTLKLADLALGNKPRGTPLADDVDGRNTNC